MRHNPKICHRKAASNTGLVGITETMTHGRPCFTVHWRPARLVRKSTTIYFGERSSFTRDQALTVARNLRRQAVQQRREQAPLK